MATRSSRAKLLDQQAEGALHERELVGRRHGAGDVEQEDEVAGRQLARVDAAALQADEHEAMVAGPGRGHLRGGDREGIAAARIGIVVGEVVDELLHAHGIGGRTLPLGEEAAHVGVGRGVHVDREGGERARRGALEAVVLEVVVVLGVERLLLAVEHRRCRHGDVELLPGHLLRRIAPASRPPRIARWTSSSFISGRAATRRTSTVVVWPARTDDVRRSWPASSRCGWREGSTCRREPGSAGSGRVGR